MSKPQGKTGGSSVLGVLAVVVCLILIPILVVNLTLIVQSFVNPTAVPSFMGYKPFIVLSGSMEPVFYPGDLVIVKVTDPATLAEGDIIAFREGSAVITHRITRVVSEDGTTRYNTKGDNNASADRISVTPDRLEGIYLRRIPRLGNTAMFMQTPTGMLVFIVIPLIGFILYDVGRRRYYDHRERSRTRDLEAELARMREQLGGGESVTKEEAKDGDVSA